METRSFLVEIGTEELPPKALAKLAAAFARGISQGLQQAQVNFGHIQHFATPRRLAVRVEALEERQQDITTEMFGPPVTAAFDKEGNPTKAAEGFARKCNTSVDQLQQVDTGKGVKLAFRSETPGQATVALLPAIVEKSLESLPIPKRMRWGSARSEFVRPVHWLIMLYGHEVVDCEILGMSATNLSRGHRFHHNQTITIERPDQYESLLQKPGFVIVDFAARQQQVREQVEGCAAELGGQAVIDPDLLDEVTALVEWPVALAGRFDEKFLRLPPEALVSSMKEHQKYFHLVNGSGQMLPNFITLANIESKDPGQVIAGNERVIRPRLADAEFFFDTDQKTPLAARLNQLKQVVFQTRLGSVHDKSERISRLCAKIAGIIGADSEIAARGALLAKADLVSNMVGEFPDLQGTMGRYYAEADGEPTGVGDVIFDHYLPRFSGDDLPSSLEGCAASLADKLDTIVGLFAIGQPPTGDKDPFAIRRAALGILRIIIEKQLTLDLCECIQLALAEYADLDIEQGLAKDVFEFMLERFRTWFQQEGIPANVYLAVYARRPSQPLDFQQRIYAVNHFAGLAEAESLAAANKRVSNILAKQAASESLTEVSPHLLQESEELELARLVDAQLENIAPLLANNDYTGALESLANLRQPVDNFFDNVMVMADEADLRNNRLALLNKLRNLFLEVADISHLNS